MDEFDSSLQDKGMNAPREKKSKKRLSVERIYQKKTQHEHILLRPDAYIGSVEPTKQTMWVWASTKACMVNKEVNFVPGLFKIFDEILVNAADNKQRDPKMNYIKIVIDPVANLISVQNNGRGIPVEMHKEENLYVPSMIFGHLLTSSNYDDTQKKVTGGRNGYGAKLCNIYSTEFTVETVCDGKHFKQTWKKNMTKTQEPKIKDEDRSDFTCIKFHPDLEKFKMVKLDDDTIALMSKRAYDIAGCVRGVAVYLNGKKLPIKSFQDYIKLYLKCDGEDSDDEGDKRKIVYEVVNKRWEVAVTTSNRGFQQASFVNSIATTKGGTHINYVVDQIVEKLTVLIKRKSGKGAVAVKPFQIKNHIWVFVNCLIENPAFDSQTKENMTLRPKAFGSQCILDEKFVKQVTHCGIVENILDWVKLKTQSQLKKCSGSKHSKLKGIPKLDDANDAGGKNSIDCTLILTEGDSAKTLAVSGLSVVGRDRYGVFPLRGKLLNVREASHKQLLENQEINNIIKILGLQYGKKYCNMDDLKKLRYGRLMIMTDQDQDGSHIKGLLINFIHHNWPDLLKLPFLEEFITPIVKVSKGREEIAFYSIPEFEEWRDNVATNPKAWRVKYYKGLGTSTPKEAKEYFADMDRHRILFDYSGLTDDEAISLAFSKKKVTERKQWLTNQLEERKARREAGLPEIYLYGPGTKRINYTDFVNKELILFSNADNERSIPSLVDGLKPGQRKVLFTCFKRNDKREVKVAQLAGSVAELSAYHHGEQSLAMTIVNLAQNFVGSNNLNLLQPIGQFGTRLHGGKDSASSRYIFTQLSPLARLVYPIHDDTVLKFLVEDNQVIEPEWYCPIIPMVLVNGADGIGTGYSTKIPNYDIRQLVKYMRDLLEDKEPEELQPSYKNFTGEINKIGNQRYEVFGKIDVVDDNTVEITELPVCTWTQTYKESVLEAMLHGTEKYKSCIIDYREHQTDTTVHFIATMADGELTNAEENGGLHKKFNLTSAINTTNMVLFDAYGAIKKFESVKEVICEFYKTRLELYCKRKEFLQGMLQAEADKLKEQARFILEKIDGTVVIENKAKRDIMMKLVERGYSSDPVKTWKESQKKIVMDDDTDDTRSEASSTNSNTGPDFSYLLGMAMLSLSKEKKEQLLQQRDDKIDELRSLLGKTHKDLWKEDLNTFLEALETVEQEEREEAQVQIAVKNKSGRSSSRATKVASKKNVAKAPKKQAKPSKPKEPKEPKVVPNDLGFSDDSENPEMLSLSERLALKKYEETSDASSITSVASQNMASKKPINLDLDDSDDGAPPAKTKPTTKKPKKAPAKQSKKAAPVNTIEKALKKQAKKSKDIDETSASSHTSSSSRKKASKRDSEYDSDSSGSVVSIEKSSKPAAKKAKISKPAKDPVKKISISSSDDEPSDGEQSSPVNTYARRQRTNVKYIVDDDDNNVEEGAGSDDWMDIDDDDSDSDSDFE